MKEQENTVTDTSGNGHTGKLVGAKRVQDSERQEKVVEFNGSDYVEMGKEDTLDPHKDSFTVSFYFKTTTTGSRVDLVTKRGGDNERFRVRLTRDNTVVFSIKDDGGFGGSGIKANGTYRDGKWHHVVAVRDTSKDELRLYIDGKQVGSAKDEQKDVNPTGPFFAGAQPEYPNPHYYTGRIDDIKIYRAAVNPEEIGQKKPNLKLQDTRLVQTVENTRIGDNRDIIDDTVLDEDIADPPLVSGRQTIVAFDFIGENLESISREVLVTISRNGNEHIGSFTLNPETVRSAADNKNKSILDIISDESEEATTYPLFPVEDGDEIEIQVAQDVDKINGDEGILKVGNQNSPITQTSELNIGIVRVENESQYGTISDDKYKRKVKNIAKYLQSTYPVKRVNVFQLGIDEPTVRGITDKDSNIDMDYVEDLSLAKSRLNILLPVVDGDHGQIISVENGQIVDESDTVIDSFDEVLALVPDNYFEHHDRPSKTGMHINWAFDSSNDNDNLWERQPITASAAEIGSPPSTAAMEIGHHFIANQFPSNIAESQLGVHADSDIYSTKYNLEGGNLNFESSVRTFMNSLGEWTDAFTYRKLIESGFDPVPPEGSFVERGLVKIFAIITDDNNVVINSFKKYSSGILTSLENGDVSIKTIDSTGNVIDERSIPDTLLSSHENGEEEKSRAIVATVPFSEEIYELKFLIEDPDTGKLTETVVNPHTKLLFNLVNNIPESAFKKSAIGRRKALNNKIDSIESMLDKKKFRPAINKLRNDFKDKLEKWLKQDYKAAANQYTKDEAINLVKDSIERLETFAQNTNNGRSGNRER